MVLESPQGGLAPRWSSSAELDRLELLADNGRRPLDWNGPAGRAFRRFNDEDLERPIIHHVERAARQYRDRIAVADSHSSLTYGALWDGLAGLAETVAARTGPGDLVAILLPASPMFPLAMLACLAAGRPFVALDPRAPRDWLDRALADARAALIIAENDAHSETAGVICLTGAPRPAREVWRPAEFGLDEPACVLFTSGSTGRPKGVVNSQRNLLQRAAQSINAAHINSDDKLLTLASLSTIVGVRDIITALVAGASVRLLDPHRAGAREILHVIRADAVSILFAFPALMRTIATFSGEQARETLRLVRMGGDTIAWSDIDLLRAWLSPGAAIQSIYAATEAPIMQWFVDESCRSEDARVPIGFPLPGNGIAVVDTDGRGVRPGEAGELVVASPYVALGLWSGGRCVADAFERSGSGRMFRTGDIVRQRPDGLLERLGRKDRQVKIHGVRVELDGVEAALRRHPFVRDVGVLARRTGDDGEAVLVAYINAHDDAPAELLDELKELVGSLPQAMRPSRIYRALRIPRLESSKLDVRALAALDDANAEAERTAPGLAGADEMARTVAHVWRKTLDRHVASATDDFFEAGGDSLKAITFVMELEQALGLELSLTLINEAPQFAQLCEVLRERRTDSLRLVSLKAGEGAPPLYFVHGLGGSVVDLFPVARRLGYPGAVVGVQACGLAAREKPHTSVEAMAVEYLRAIKARQPEGPYHLCGYSFGGLVAFEMARRLRQAGDEVGLVALFDTTLGALHWPASVWLDLVRGRLARVPDIAVGAWKGMSNFVKRIAGKLKVEAAPTQAKDLPSILKSAPTRVLTTAAAAFLASARYRPGFYPGEVKLFIPDERDPALPSSQAIWRRHARSLSVVPVAGDHLTMMSARNAEATAEALRRCLPD